jgi:hypothetical protein
MDPCLTSPLTPTINRSESSSSVVGSARISDTNTNSKYIQTHFSDAAFGERPDSAKGTGNHAWTGRDDMTELYFRDWAHLKACFGSSYVRTKIGPDGANFNDLDTAIPLMVLEKPLDFESKVPASDMSEDGYRTVAVLFVATPSSPEEADAELLEQRFSPLLSDALAKYAGDDVYGVQANVSIPASQFDIRAYFGGRNMPEYPVTYKLYMKDDSGVAAVRSAQKAFMAQMGERIDAGNTFIAFGKEGLVLDVGNGIKVSHGGPWVGEDTNACSSMRVASRGFASEAVRGCDDHGGTGDV